MDTQPLQQLLFQKVKSMLPPQASLAESIARVLDISVDSAYRRVRGETMIDLDEAKKICLNFDISLDSMMGYHDGKFIFSSNLISQDAFDFEEYLRGVLRSMQYFHSIPEKKLFYDCKDIPLFYHFHSRELAAFKYYFWMKFLMQQKSFSGRKFSFDDYPDEIFQIGLDVFHLYNTMPSVEFWNLESLHSTLRQIKFFYDTGCFTRRSDVELIFEKLLDFIAHFEDTAALGEKLPVAGKEPTLPGGSFDVYHNEAILGSNMIIAKLGPSQITFLNHSVFNYATTTDLVFGAYIFKYIENLIHSSTRISSSNEVERSEFFASLRRFTLEYLKKL